MPTVFANSILNFPVVDPTGLLELTIYATFPSLGRTELIYETGAFLDPYLASTKDVVSPTTLNFHVTRSPAWGASFVLTVEAIDVDTHVVLFSDTYTLDSGVTPTPPPLPEPTPTATTGAIYDALYQAVGDGLRADDGSIVETWRYSRALGIEASTKDAHATDQAFPNRATDFLPVYEEILGINPGSGQTTEDRQTEASAQWTRSLDASHPGLLQMLQAIDSDFLIIPKDHDLALVTEMGWRAFEDWDPSNPLACGPGFNLFRSGQAYSVLEFPNYSDEFVLYVMLNTGTPGVVTPTQLRSLSLAVTSLNEVLPGWVDFRIFTTGGFILDRDLLDLTALADGATIP